jgi:hypothetical protein
VRGLGLPEEVIRLPHKVDVDEVKKYLQEIAYVVSNRNVQDISAGNPIKHQQENLQSWNGRLHAYLDVLYMIQGKENARATLKLDDYILG